MSERLSARIRSHWSFVLAPVVVLLALCVVIPATASAQGGTKKTGSSSNPNIIPNSCNPAVGCGGGNPPTVWFTHVYGTIYSGAAITDTVHWCDDTGLNGSSRSVTRNGSSLSTTYATSAYSGCWQHATSVFSFTPVPGSNTIYASIQDNMGQVGSAQFTLTYDTTHVKVTPKGVAHAKPALTSVADTFTVQNLTSSSVTYTLALTCTHSGNLGCATTSPLTVGGNSSGTAIVTYETRGLNTVDTVSLRATSSDGHQTDNGSVIETASQYATSVSFANDVNDDQNLALCGNSCFTATVTHSTPSYRTLGADRSVSLVYQGDRTAVRPFISADVTLGPGSTAPNEVDLQAKVNGAFVPFVNGDTTIRFSTSGWTGGQTYRVAGQVDGRIYTTDMESLKIIVTSVYSDHNESDSTPPSTKLMVVNLNSPDILPTVGWTVAGIQRLVFQTDSTALIIEGDGSGTYFACNSYHVLCAGPTGDYSTLRAAGTGGSATYTRAYPDSTKVVFNSSGHMTSVTDRWGNTSTITYDGSGHISTIGDPKLSSYFQFTYGTGYFTIGLPRPGGGTPADSRQTTVMYNTSSDRVSSITDADSNATNFTFDSNGRLSTIIDRLGDTTSYFYDTNSWKLDSVALPTVAIDNGGGTTQNKRPVLHERDWEQVGVPTGRTNITAAPSVRIDTIYGLSIDALGFTTKFTADRWGQPLKEIDPLGNTTTIVRTGIFATSITDPVGHTSTYSYTNGFLSSATPYGQPTTTMTYDAWGMPDYVTGGGNPTVTRTFNASGRTIKTILAGVDTSTDSLDTNGRVFFTKDIAGNVTRYHYDPTFGNLDSTTAAAGQWERHQLDGYGRDSVVTASSLQASIQHIYDTMGREIQAYDGVHSTPVKTSYNAEFVTATRDQAGQYYKQDVNALGWPTVEYDPADTTSWTRKTTLHYDVDGRVTSEQNERGEWITMQYDSLGRLTSRRDTTGTADSLSYSANGRLVVASNGVEVDTIRVGDRGADTVITHIAGQWFTRIHTATAGTTADTTYLTSSIAALSLLNRMRFWDASLGVLDSMKVGSNVFRVHYNSALLPDTLTEPNALKRWDAYTTTYSLYSRDYPTGLDSVFARRFAYDSLGRIITDQKVNGYSNGWIWGLKNYAYTGTGALRWYQIAHTQNRSCDPNYGCTFAGTIVDTTYGYQYDAVNNLTQEADSTPCCVTNGTFSTGNRLTGWGSTSYTYDTDGNRATKGGGTTYTWSATGKLMQVANGSSTVEFAYNALGELARRKTNGTIDRYYVWDGGQLLYVLDGAGNRLSDFSYLPSGEPLALSRGSTGASVSFFTTDGHGNVIGLTDGSAVQQRLSYAPWGATSQSGFSLDTTALAWKGNVWEGGITGLYYVQNRWYDPVSRGFISGDPIGLAGGINTYAYAGNDPINGWDPSGTKPVIWCVFQMTQKPAFIYNGSEWSYVPAVWTQYCMIEGGGQDGSEMIPLPPRTSGFIGMSGTGGGRPDEHKQAPPVPAWLSARCGAAVKDFGFDLGLNMIGVEAWDLIKESRKLPAAIDALSTEFESYQAATAVGAPGDLTALLGAGKTYATAVGKTAAAGVDVGTSVSSLENYARTGQGGRAEALGNALTFVPGPWSAGYKLGLATDICAGAIN